MTYETFVKEMLDNFPHLGTDCYGYMDEGDPLPYVAIGCVLIPWLERCLETQDANNITRACEFLEVTATEGLSDSRLDDLIGIEIGEWLSGVRERKLLLSYFGRNTWKACSYHIARLSD